MKAFSVLFGAIIFIIVAGTTFGQGEVKQAPLTWQQAALTDGEELYVELCAVCHGDDGMGGGPAASALKYPVPDLTRLAANNDGEFPREEVQASIAGKSRPDSHLTVNMPNWEEMFEEVRRDRKMFHREALARQRIYNLTEYLSSIQTK